MANSLLVDQKTSSSTTTTTSTSGVLDIQPNLAEMSLPMESSDTLEITGNCKDLDKRNNRILVEVYAGEDESTDPFISNNISDICQDTTSAVQSGLTSASGTCFWVTKGTGLVENSGLPTQKTFPQCHNGQFGFSVRLGKVLVSGATNLKYLVRFKLRTLDGTISDTTWSKVTVERKLSKPVINSITPDSTMFKCEVKSSPARFNFGILYTLTRTYTDIVSTAAGPTALFSNLTTNSVSVGTSVFDWNDYALAEGVTYNYTLTAKENNFAYTTAPTADSTAVTCILPKPVISQTGAPSANTCYLGMTSAANPYWGAGISYEWGYVAANSSWIGPNGNTNSGYTVGSCGNTTYCTQGGLGSGITYYFAIRSKSSNGEIGPWSATVPCKPL